MAKYRKKPVEIEAIQYTSNNKQEIDKFVGSQLMEYNCYLNRYLIIPTLEGNMKCNLYDYVIKEVNGEFYSCKPDIFEKTYDKVDL